MFTQADWLISNRIGLERTKERYVLIRFSPKSTTGSIEGHGITMGQTWVSTYLSGMICLSRARFLNFSTSFRTRRRALPILNVHDGERGLSVVTVGRLMSRIASPIALVSSDAAIVAVIIA